MKVKIRQASLTDRLWGEPRTIEQFAELRRQYESEGYIVRSRVQICRAGDFERTIRLHQRYSKGEEVFHHHADVVSITGSEQTPKDFVDVREAAEQCARDLQVHYPLELNYLRNRSA